MVAHGRKHRGHHHRHQRPTLAIDGDQVLGSRQSDAQRHHARHQPHQRRQADPIVGQQPRQKRRRGHDRQPRGQGHRRGLQLGGSGCQPGHLAAVARVAVLLSVTRPHGDREHVAQAVELHGHH